MTDELINAVIFSGMIITIISIFLFFWWLDRQFGLVTDSLKEIYEVLKE